MLGETDNVVVCFSVTLRRPLISGEVLEYLGDQ